MSAFRSRGRTNGRILRPEDTFILRPDIAMPGAYPLSDAVREVKAEWHKQAEEGLVTTGTIGTHSKHLSTLAKFAIANGATLVCDVTNALLNEWMFAPNAYNNKPVAATVPGARRAVASSFYYTCFRLGITDVNVAATLPTRENPPRYVHAFTSNDIDLLKEASEFAYRETKSPAALALALCGAAPGEVGSIRCADVRLLERKVRAHGGGNRYVERWLPIADSWCFDKLAARIKNLSQTHPDDWCDRYIAYDPREGNDDNFNRRSAAASTTLATIIKKAGLKNNGVSRVASINEYVAANVFKETGRIEAVAARLGISKLDDAAKVVGYDWRTKYELAGPNTAAAE